MAVCLCDRTYCFKSRELKFRLKAKTRLNGLKRLVSLS
ncbi:hypothetical protein MC7420_7918 [Coleofasciculus chthonoplastes PCC 7420]|uniref:Uncharacterized protein n=1 Tax=Coleofasciculus chthonoplastes PCC 7420 TaxID=118168 RepID=B4VJ56_9CYAN|nr:hypothetical protein MC7420_7918 [Coleofasciculus chthonoplastes PCC 7420]